MRVADLIQKFKDLGFDDDTDIDIGGYDKNGDWYDFDFEIADEDRQFNPHINCLEIVLEPPDEYINSRFDSRFDMDRIAERITSSVYQILNSDAE